MLVQNKFNRDVFDTLPEDVKAILALFPDTYSFHSNMSGDYFDIQNDGGYFFYQPVARSPAASEANRRRFCSWVRAGMPEGYTDDDDAVWTRED